MVKDEDDENDEKSRNNSNNELWSGVEQKLGIDMEL
jgi:hypothetical protein